jgi:protocatechuate 3,4-dioxygenase beta subunit
MEEFGHTLHTRRQMLHALVGLPATLALASFAGLTVRPMMPEALAQAPTLPATPACTDGDEITPRQMEGPYYKRSSPERASLLEPGLTGTRLVVAGFVLSRRCQPIERALLDFWHADDQGQYDNRGYRCRGHQFTDAAGRYHLETIVPGVYPGRARHIHVKAQAPNGPLLTTQLYFPGEPHNARDRLFNPALSLAIQDTADGKAAQFSFILDLS